MGGGGGERRGCPPAGHGGDAPERRRPGGAGASGCRWLKWARAASRHRGRRAGYPAGACTCAPLRSPRTWKRLPWPPASWGGVDIDPAEGQGARRPAPPAPGRGGPNRVRRGRRALCPERPTRPGPRVRGGRGARGPGRRPARTGPAHPGRSRTPSSGCSTHGPDHDWDGRRRGSRSTTCPPDLVNPTPTKPGRAGTGLGYLALCGRHGNRRPAPVVRDRGAATATIDHPVPAMSEAGARRLRGGAVPHRIRRPRGGGPPPAIGHRPRLRATRLVVTVQPIHRVGWAAAA